MTVAKLIDILKTMPQDHEVVFSREGEWDGIVKKVNVLTYVEEENKLMGTKEAIVNYPTETKVEYVVLKQY